MDFKSALKTALPQATQKHTLKDNPLRARVVEMTQHLEDLGGLWFRVEHAWLVTGRYNINRATSRPHQWYENFFIGGEGVNEIRKALNRYLETERLDVLSAVYNDQAVPKVDRVTPVLTELQRRIYSRLEIDGSYDSIEATGTYKSPRLPKRYFSNPIELRCQSLFLKRYDKSTDAEKRKHWLKKVASRLYSTDTARANTIRQTYQALGGNAADLEFWDERLAKRRARLDEERKAWKAEEEDN